jgi:hypothetical protein
MSVPLAAPSSKLLPFEVAILQAVARTLPERLSELLSQQLAVVNKVQRLLEWNEIEFYCMRWFKVRWPDHVLFPRRDEHSLAEVQCAFGGTEVPVTVWAVHGHVFSLESSTGLKALANSGDKFEVRHVRVATT